MHFNMSIGNAHEFAHHTSLELLAAFDTLLVNEEYNRSHQVTNPEGINLTNQRYSVLGKTGEPLFTVVDTTGKFPYWM